jgi:enoyl-CoA hydratase
MAPELVLYEAARGVATITFNRPEKLNALSFAMRETWTRMLEEAERDPDVHVVVLKGNGPAFSVGVDLADVMTAARDSTALGGRLDAMQIAEQARLWSVPWDLQKPVIVQAHGYCVAVALEIALRCDLILAAEDAQFGHLSIRNGTGLPECAMDLYHVPPQWAKRLWLTGELIDGRTAAQIGLVLEAVPAAKLEARVNDLAARIASVPVDLLAASKQILNRAIDLMGRPVLQQLAPELNAIARANPEAMEFARRVRSEGVPAALAWRAQRSAARA